MTDLTAEESARDRAARREGVITGLWGASAVALFYFVVDLLRGHPLMTPSVLGQAFIMRTPITTTPETAAVLLYTAFHLLAFIAFGLFLAALVRGAESSALARYAIVQLFVVFEVGFYFMLSIASAGAQGQFSLMSVLTANTLAAVAMGTWQWRHHPAVRAALRTVPLGDTEPHPVVAATSARRT